MSEQWGAILVVGGTGRLGYFVIRDLLQQPECGRIVSINRKPNAENQHDGVQYLALDLRNADGLEKLMQDLKPMAIINTAAPAHADTLTPASEFYDTLVRAQDNLIKIAKEFGTGIFISTTSANVAAGHGHHNVKETHPRWPLGSKTFAYWVMRAEAERKLLAADCPELQTLSLRLPLIIGEREYVFVPNMLKMLHDGQTNVQVGNGKAKMATISSDNAARAHVIALRALLEPHNNVHGEAFYITGARPLPFWTMGHVIWTIAGWKQEKQPWIIPYWLMTIIAAMIEAIVFVASGGTREPWLSQHVVRFMGLEWTYDGSKAERMLGFVPEDDTEQALRDATLWQLKKEQRLKTA